MSRLKSKNFFSTAKNSVKNKSHYDLLNLSPLSSDEEIRKSFANLTKKLHPDVSSDPSDHQRFLQIKNAYNILSSAKSRKKYDQELGLDFSSNFNKKFANQAIFDEFLLLGNLFCYYLFSNDSKIFILRKKYFIFKWCRKFMKFVLNLIFFK